MTKEIQNHKEHHKEKVEQYSNKKQEETIKEENLQKKEEELKIAKEDKKEDEKEKIIKELTDKYLRSLAEFENFKKRVTKEKEDFIKFTRADIILEFLPILDNLQRAVDSIKNAKDTETIKQGIEIILKQFIDNLSKLEVKEVDTSGKVNTDFHHILAKEEREDKEEGEILEVFQKGYMYQDKLIRPALVKVAVKKEKSEQDNKN